MGAPCQILQVDPDEAVRERELQRQADRLQRQNDRLDRFASIVSHDLRNPLEVARGHLDLSDADDDHLDRVAAMHERMDDLLEDLLTLAREGDRVSDTERIELASLAEACWQSVETDGVTLEVTGTLSFAADRNGVRQLLENLYRNAIEHGRTDDRSVTIRVGDLDDGFFVEDDGPGIAPEIRDRIFDPGFSTDEEGTGYGLSIVAEIVDGHDWAISIGESDAGGARFEIRDVDVRSEDPTESAEATETAASVEADESGVDRE